MTVEVVQAIGQWIVLPICVLIAFVIVMRNM